MFNKTILFYFIFGALTFLLCVKYSFLILIVYLLFLFIFGLFNNNMALVGYCIASPLASMINGPLISMAVPTILLSIIIRNLMGKKTIFKDKKLIIFVLVLSLLPLFSSLLSGYTMHIHVVFVLFFNLVLGYLISQYIILHEEGFCYVSYGIILSTIIGLSVIFLTGEAFSSLGRLQVEGSVRVMANLSGLSIILITSGLFYQRYFSGLNPSLVYPFQKMKLLGVIILFVLILSLVMTVSRGVIVSSLICLFFMALYTAYHFRYSLGTMKSFTLLLFPYVIFGAFSFIIIFFVLGSDHVVLSIIEKRFSGEYAESGFDIRVNIWKSALNQFDLLNWIFGYGKSSFTYLARKGGYDFYSHSVFIDILTESGIFGLFFLASMIISLFIKSFKHQIVLGLGLLTYLVLSFSSHGSTNSLLFWIVLGISYGVVFKSSQFKFGVKNEK